MDLPSFKYHIDPVGNGVIEKSDLDCLCCGKETGYIYTGSVYAIEDLDDAICPWCIANGAAAKKFNASFSDSHPLMSSGVPGEIVKEVTDRNPGYQSWQQENWLSHCHDACEFHGDASIDDVKNASEETKAAWLQDNDGDVKLWNQVTSSFVSGGDLAFYKFRCRHCDLTLLGWDCS
jgi:uncharacterized protein CbrC (UPF0167 family)